MADRKNKDPRLQHVWPQIAEAFGTEDVKLIADRMGVSKSTVYDWRSGKAVLLDNLYSISDETGFSIHYLLTGKGPQKIDAKPGYYVELNEAQRQDIARLAKTTGVSVEEQMARIVFAAIFVLEYLTRRSLSGDVFEKLLEVVSASNNPAADYGQKLSS